MLNEEICTAIAWRIAIVKPYLRTLVVSMAFRALHLVEAQEWLRAGS